MIRLTTYGDVTRIDSARTLFGRGRYWTTAYIVDGLLIDSGCAHTSTELLRALRDVAIHTLINTHAHEDHIGSNGAIQREREIPISAHPEALPVLEHPRREQPLQPYRKVMWGWPEPSRGKALQDGQVIATTNLSLRVIYTPGHSRDHICLYEPERRWLFSGDLFVGGEDRALGASYDIWDILRSLRKVARLPLRTLYPGCARVRHRPGQELESKINYLEELGQRVLDLHAVGHSERSIVRELCGGPLWIELLTLGHFSRRNLVRSYLNRPSD